MLEKTLVSSLDCKEIQPVYPKGNQSWIFIGRTDAEAETPMLWPHDANWLTRKDPDAGKDWRLEKGMTEDEMVGWHQWTWVWVDSGSWWWTGRPAVLQSMGSQSQTWLRDWTELNLNLVFLIFLTLDLCKWRWLCVKLEAWEVWGRTYMRRINQEYGIEV